MLDIKKIRNSPDEILKFLNRKDKNISLDNILKIDSELEYINMKISLIHYSFDHSHNENWWETKTINSFNIELSN